MRNGTALVLRGPASQRICLHLPRDASLPNRRGTGPCREGVRALPPRTQHGSLPLLGCVSAGRPWWLVAGLGSRGLVYHGWLGRLVAEAALGEALAGPAPSASASFARGLDSAGTGGVGLREVECAGAAAGAGAVVQGMAVEGRGEGEGEAGLPEELTAWRRVAPGAAVFEAP